MIEMVGHKYCSDINNPEIFVTVVGVRKRGGGYQVIFNRGMTYNLIAGYKKFMKRYPYELQH